MAIQAQKYLKCLLLVSHYLKEWQLSVSLVFVPAHFYQKDNKSGWLCSSLLKQYLVG